MKIAYGELIGGISGDMFVAAMLDLGLPLVKLKSELKKIAGLRYRLTVLKKTVQSIRATRFHVVCPDKEKARSWKQIRSLIAKSRLPSSVKETGIDIFSRLAAAEGKIHGVPSEQVHFHEVGATDSIVDIMAAAIGVRELGIEAFHFSSIPLGRGITRSMHGVLPVPGPATLELLKGLPAFGVDLESETVTPTGAAIVRTLGKTFGEQPAMTVEKIGYGAGQKDFATRPNLFRLSLGADAGPLAPGGDARHRNQHRRHESRVVRLCFRSPLGRRCSRRVPVTYSNEEESTGNITPRHCSTDGSRRVGANHSEGNLDPWHPLLPCRADHPRARLRKA